MNKKKSIWFEEFPLAFVQRLADDYLPGHLGIEFLEAGDDYLKARMPVDRRTRQPDGLLHGGASVALAETLASLASTFVVDRGKQSCVGLEINANHVRAAREGFVYGIATPIHLGRTTHVWDVRIRGDNDKTMCISRVTIAVLDRPSQHI